MEIVIGMYRLERAKTVVMGIPARKQPSSEG
jgi:hypothetical protein